MSLLQDGARVFPTGSMILDYDSGRELLSFVSVGDGVQNLHTKPEFTSANWTALLTALGNGDALIDLNDL